MRTTIAHTADLGDLALLRTFLFEVFGDDYDEAAWDHTLGGMHVLLTDGDAIAAHAAVVGRRMRHAGRWWRTGWVESVAVGAAHRRQGLAGQAMEEIHRLIRGGYELGGLAASEDGMHLYPGLGWDRWRGPLRQLGEDGLQDSADNAVFVLQGATPVDLDGELVCDPRDGSVW
jgi:aminoglycoside 2'-N-acetyltransferase I